MSVIKSKRGPSSAQFLEAYAELQSLISQITTAYEMFPVEESVIVEWMRLIQQELGLLKSLMKSDKLRKSLF